VPVRIVTVWAWGGSTGPGTTGKALDAASMARQARQTQEALVRAVLARFPGALPELTTELVQGDPASALIDRSRDGDLLVLGSQGVSGAEHLVGSVADTCLRHGTCPVVVVPAGSTRGSAVDGLIDQRPPSEPRSGLAPAVLGALGLL
jgi:nucleotide-binding universal stress UspA family protein